ncbi:BTAD domain-containing putative transcriptional regulator [Micromonospora rubida]|uniref:BTAD domain-containing putative transcriptional regulator n=1 Tax=Micromonospora rubida TaxID=2697657 RepID=A0ABW7SWB9_9ACTN
MVDVTGAGPASFGATLRELRERGGLTQQELARAAGVSVAAVRDLEQGRSRAPRHRSVRSLAEALGLPADKAAALVEAARPTRTAAGPQRAHASRGPVRICVLGPLAMFRGAVAVPLGAGRHRVVLARLALTPNSGVSRDELIDLLWGEEVPPSAVNLVQTYVSRLRRALEPQRTRADRSELLTLVAGGYRLDLAAEQLDLLGQRELLTRARSLADDPAAVLDLVTRALGHWRGPTLADVPELRGEPLVTAVEEERIAAAILHARAAGALRQDDRALPELRKLAGEHPLHEPLQARLVTTLAGAGQQAAALAAYDSVRRRLADELGIDPGTELVEAHRAVLGPPAGQVPVETRPVDTVARPFQTPAAPADFTGREDHLRRLARLVGRNPGRPAPASMTVCVISGVAGVGKTTLALRAAHLLRPSFPDGQLYVDLQGFGPLPTAPADALARFLRALGVEGRRVPRDEAECGALFRSILAERRMLVVLDNARTAAQVRALMPGTGSNAMLVTSRNRLPDLAGAVMVELGLPNEAEAVDMLAASAGPARVAAEKDAAIELARACGLLPIALRVAGGRLASRPEWTVRAAVERLADRRHRLDRLRIGDVAVRASFDLSYQELSAGTARAFRLLALLPGGDFGVAAAAVLIETDEADAEDTLQDLVDGNLVQVFGDGRYRYHDLLRLYAARRADAEDPAGERSAGMRRLLDWYLERTVAAMLLIYPDMVRLPTDARTVTPFRDESAALAWIDEELTGLTAAARAAGEGPCPERAWQLVDQLRGYFFVRRQAVPWLAAGRAGLAAAERAGDPLARAAMHQTIGQAYWSVGDHPLALAEYERAAGLAQQAGWRVGLAYQLHNIGLVQAEMGSLDAAQESYRRALATGHGREFGHVRAVTLNDLGALCHERGQLSDAAACFAEALSLNQGTSRRKSSMSNRSNLGMVLRQLGDHDAARTHLRAALEHYLRIGSPAGELSVLDELSQLHAQCDEPEAALATATRALELTRELADRRSEAALLSTLGSALLCAGAVAEAAVRFDDSLALARQLSSPYFEVQARIGLSRVRLLNGAVEQATTQATLAVELARLVGYRMLEGDALLALARAYVAVGADDDAARCCRDALEIRRASGLPAGAAGISSLLTRLGIQASPITSRRVATHRSRSGTDQQPAYLG